MNLKAQNSICLICMLIMGLTYCSKKECLFERSCIDVEKEAELSLKKDYFGNLYYGKTNVTFRFEANTNKMEIQSGIIGEIGINFGCIADSDGILQIYKKEQGKDGQLHQVEELSINEGYNDLSFFINLDKNEHLVVKSLEGSGVVFSKPVIYKLLPPDKRTNIFLISVDTLSSLHMSMYEYQRKTTPNIKGIAQDAVVFLNAFSNSSWTVSSHMSLFTSLLEHGHKVEELKNYVIENEKVMQSKPLSVFPLSYSIPFLVESISEDFITLSYNGGLKVNAVFGFYRGFDLYFSNWDDFTSPKASEMLFQEVEDKLVKSKFPKTFYFLHTYQVHAPHNPRISFLNKISKNTKLKDFDYERDLGGNRYIFKKCDDRFVEDVKSLYDAEILNFDHYFGKFIEFLKTENLYDSSMIILLADHGEEFFEHERWAHGSDLYNEQIRIPLIIKFPYSQFSGKKINENVSLLDVLPTLMEFYGMKAPKDVSGRSLMPVIKDGKGFNRPVVSSIFRFKPFEMLPGKIAVIKDNLKIIYNEKYTRDSYKYFVHRPPSIMSKLELYDLEKDPGERENLFSKECKERDYLFQYIKILIKEMDEAKKSEVRGEKQKISKEMRERLRSLGYVDK